MQAFASSITGALATEAILKGAGVGDQVNECRFGTDGNMVEFLDSDSISSNIDMVMIEIL
jgi:hypothetical protein